MADIEKIAFGKNLRPSTIDVMNKLNEVIDIVNDSTGQGLKDLKDKVDQLDQNQTNLVGTVTNLTDQYNALEPRVQANEQDLTNVKVTLYTPLSSDDND